MVEVTAYPYAYNDIGGNWVNPSAILGSPNATCASLASTGRLYRIELSQFYFDIPSAAILDYVYIGLKSNTDVRTGGRMYPYIVLAINGFEAGLRGSSCIAICTCRTCQNQELPDDYAEILASRLTADMLNSEEGWTLMVWKEDPENDYPNDDILVDAVWIRVVYHLPSRNKQILGDGLASVIA